VVGEPALGIGESRPVREHCDACSEFQQSECSRFNDGLRLLSGQVINDRDPGVGASGAAYLIEIRVQQLLKPLPATPNTGVMEFDFESLQF
jgi:hypothetical protein